MVSPLRPDEERRLAALPSYRCTSCGGVSRYLDAAPALDARWVVGRCPSSKCGNKSRVWEVIPPV